MAYRPSRGVVAVFGLVLPLAITASPSICAADDAPAAPAPAGRDLPGADAADELSETAPRLFVTDRTALRRLSIAETRIAAESFDEAIDLLQAVLDADEDSTAPVEGRDGTFQSVKRRALELIGRLPPEGRRVYELKFGINAGKRFDDAVRRGDWDAADAISRQFFHTAAGYEATYRLATRAQDRGDALQAALLYGRLLDVPGAGEAYEPNLSLRSATAWLSAGLREPALKSATRYLDRSKRPQIAGGLPVPPTSGPEELLGWLDRSVRDSAVTSGSAWPVYGGGAQRSGEVAPVTLAGGVEWSFPAGSTTEWDDRSEIELTRLLNETLGDLKAGSPQTGALTQPAFHPVVAGNAVIFRTLRNLQAVDAATGRFLWQTARLHDVLFDRATDPANTDLVGDAYGRATLREEFVSQHAWRSTTSGSLTTDGRYVYGIEGAGLALTNRPLAIVPGSIPEPIDHEFNLLVAYDVAAEGRVAWTAGGRPADATSTGMFFLGPPLPLGRHLYCLAEEDGEIRLVVLDPAADRDEDRIAWTQTLVATDRSIRNDPVRRLSGLSPALDDGILVCPTGTGAVVGFDLSRRLLLWGYQYPRNFVVPVTTRPNPLGMLAGPSAPNDEVDRWLDSVPRIAEGAALLTPRDSDELHCLDLADGTLRWKRPREQSLFLAVVHDGKAVLVGREKVIAVDLTSGESAWRNPVKIPSPAGTGVRSGDLYHLPLSNGQIWTLRLSTGQVLARSPFGGGVEPGNLIAADGRLLSQSVTDIAGFRRQEEFEAEMRSVSNPVATMLALRGEDRLHRGLSAEGLADLRQATATEDLPRARRLLAEALLDGLRTDFTTYRRYEADLRRLTDDPEQRTEFLRLFADGLYAAAEYRRAFEAYVDLSDAGPATPTTEPVGDGRLVRSDRLLRGRIAGLYASAATSDRAGMESVLEDRLAKATERQDLGALERIAALFVETPIGPAAWHAVAAYFEAAGEPLRAEQALLKMRDASSTDDASIASPALERLWSGSRSRVAPKPRFDRPFRAEYLPDEIETGRRPTEVANASTVRVVGPRPVDLDGWQFEIDVLQRHLIARDALGRSRWEIDLQPGGDGRGQLQSISGTQLRFSGHLMAFAGGARLLVFDVSGESQPPRLLWSRDLSDRRFGEVDLLRIRQMRDPGAQSVGTIGFAGAELLLYQVGTTITAADPLTGHQYWQQSGVTPGCEMTGDSEFALLQPPDTAEAMLVSVRDGRRLGVRPTVESPQRLAWRGTQLLTWRKENDASILACRDIARGTNVWSRSFAATAMNQPLGDRQIGVLEPADGRFSVIELSDGTGSLTAAIDPDPTIDRFLPLHVLDRYLVFTRRPEPRGRLRVEQDWWRFPVDGLAYAFDEAGHRLWSKVIRRQYLSPDQPAGLPFLFLTAKAYPAGGEPNHQALILDVRTGETLIEQSRLRSFQPFRSAPRSSPGSLVVAVSGGRFDLVPADGPLRPGQSDGPKDLQESSDAVEPAGKTR